MTMSQGPIVGIESVSRQLCILRENFFPYITLPEGRSFPKGAVALVDWRSLAKNFHEAVLRVFDRLKWQYYPSLYLNGTEKWLPRGETHSVPFLQPENVHPPNEISEESRNAWESLNYTGEYGESVRIWIARVDTVARLPVSDKTSPTSPADFLDCLLMIFVNPGICFMEEVVLSGSDYALGLGMRGILSIMTRDRSSLGKRILRLSAYQKNRVPYGLASVQFLSLG